MSEFYYFYDKITFHTTISLPITLLIVSIQSSSKYQEHLPQEKKNNAKIQMEIAKAILNKRNKCRDISMPDYKTWGWIVTDKTWHIQGGIAVDTELLQPARLLRAQKQVYRPVKQNRNPRNEYNLSLTKALKICPGEKITPSINCSENLPIQKICRRLKQNALWIDLKSLQSANCFQAC